MFLEDKTLNPGTPVIADPFSLEALIGWLEKQPGETEYCFINDDQCLWAKYTTAMGGTLKRCPGRYEIGSARMSLYLKDGSWQNKVANGQYNTGDTFGAALERARSLTRTQGE